MEVNIWKEKSVHLGKPQFSSLQCGNNNVQSCGIIIQEVELDAPVP